MMAQTDQVKFSICIPAFKQKHLKECIASILAQVEESFELVILNDNSPEPVEDTVMGFDDHRIRYYSNERNVGAYNLVNNWNKCLELSKGEYIVIMGDDDLLEPDYLQEFSKLIGLYPDLEVFHCRSQIIDDAGKTQLLTPSCPNYEDVYDAIWHRLNQYRSNYISDFMYRTASLRERGGFYFLPLAWGADDITSFIAAAEKGIAHSNRPVFKYRSHALSISSTSSNDLDKLQADMGYADWLRGFLSHQPVHLSDLTVYHHLLAHQDRYMHTRKIFTMTKLMMHKPIGKAFNWFKNRKKYQISTKDILLAALKSRKLKLSS
jgi:glycosyltransferase involved in cell wall biosynthesis